MDMRTILQKFWHFLEANAELARDVNQWRLKVPAADAEGGAERWITLSNGNRCKIDGEGNVTAGFKGFMGKNVSELGPAKDEIKPYSPPARGYEEYLKAAQEAGGKDAHVQAAKQFYKENLRNTYVTTTFGDLGKQDVHFTAKGGKKLTFDLESNPLKAALIEDLPVIIQGRNYAGSSGPSHERADYDRFHKFNATLTKTVNGQVKRVRVHVDVGQREDSYEVNEAYHLSQDGKKEVALAEPARPLPPPPVRGEANQSRTSAQEPNPKPKIAQVFEFVNLGIMEEGN